MKKYIKFMKELWKKPYGKAVYFFGFYLIFFIALGIISNTMGKSTTNENYNNTSNNIRFLTLSKYNYTFNYKVVLDGVTYSYEGNKLNDTFNYIYDGIEYYNDNGKSYKKEDLKEVDNPIKFDKFLDEESIYALVKSAYVESKTTYDSGAALYSLLLSSNTINKLISDKDTDIDEVPNKIKISVDENKFIKEVNYSLDSYCKINELCKSSLNVTISLDNYSKKTNK